MIPIIFLILSIPAGSAFGQEAPGKPNPTGALFRSALIPGWGQVYNKKYVKAGVIALGEGYLIYGISNDWNDADRYERNFRSASDAAIKAREFNNFEEARDSRNLKMWILATVIFYSMFDAYVDAHLADFNQSDKAYEVFVTPKNDGVQLVLSLEIK
jgi:hypothetical protein